MLEENPSRYSPLISRVNLLFQEDDPTIHADEKHQSYELASPLNSLQFFRVK